MGNKDKFMFLANRGNRAVSLCVGNCIGECLPDIRIIARKI
jgi:hypothetical protein